MRAEDTKMSDSKPNINACWWACLPDQRSNSDEQDLIAQGKVERFGMRESFRMEEKARRASTESPLRASSAMIEFQDQTLVLSTYLLNKVVRLGLFE